MGDDLAKTDRELLLAAADDEGGGLGRLLKFSKGQYLTGDDKVVVGTHMIAHVKQYMRGYVKFVDGKLVEQRIGRVLDGFTVPQREELGDNDQSKWQKDGAGKPRDPWLRQSYLPMEDEKTGEILVFVTGSEGGRRAVSTLCKIAANHLAKGQPIVALATRSYKHPEYGRIENPEFTVIGWTGDDTASSVVTLPSSPSNAGSATVHPAFDDHIPF